MKTPKPAVPRLSAQGELHMILLLMKKVEAPLLLIAIAARSMRDMRTALGARASAIPLVAGIHRVAH